MLVGSNTWLDIAVGFVLALVGAIMSAETFTACVVLTGDSISCGTIFRKQSLYLTQVRYRREYEEYQDSPDGGINVSYLELIPHNGRLRSLKISKDDFDFDHIFWARILCIPELEDPGQST